jgi:Flp pilus assembly protein TadB
MFAGPHILSMGGAALLTIIIIIIIIILLLLLLVGIITLVVCIQRGLIKLKKKPYKHKKEKFPSLLLQIHPVCFLSLYP